MSAALLKSSPIENSSFDSGCEGSYDGSDNVNSLGHAVDFDKQDVLHAFQTIGQKIEGEIRRLRQENLDKNSRIQQMGIEVHQQQDMVQQLTFEVEGMRENLEKEKSQRKKLFEELQQLNIKKEEFKESVERERREKEVQLVKLQDLSKENEKLQATLCAAESERGQLRYTLGKTNGELHNTQTELDLAKSSVKKLREEKMKITSELQDERAEKEETQQMFQKTVKQKDKYAEQVQQLEAQKATLQTSLDVANLTLKKTQENLQQNVAELMAKIKNLEDERSALQHTIQEQISAMDRIHHLATEQSKNFNDKNAQLQRLTDELRDKQKTLEEVTRIKDIQVEEIRTQVQEALEKEDERTAKAEEDNLTTLNCIKLANKGIESSMSSRELKAILSDIKKILEPCAAKINASTAGDKRSNLATLRAFMKTWRKGKLSTDRKQKELYLENIRRHYTRLVDGLGYHLDTASGQDLLDKLYQEGVIEEAELEALRNTAQKPQRSRKFLEILKSKNVKVFQRLIKILRQDPHREHLACAVEGTKHPELSDGADTDSDNNDNDETQESQQDSSHVPVVTRAETTLIIVGSSMGGWLGLIAAMERPERVQAFIEIAASPDFPDRKFQQMPKQLQEKIMTTGEVDYPSSYGQFIMTRDFLLDSRQHNILHFPTISVHRPIRLLHGVKDDAVPKERRRMAGTQLISSPIENSSVDSGYQGSFDGSDNSFGHAVNFAKEDVLRVFETLQDAWQKKEEENRRLRQENLAKNKRIQQMGIEVDQQQDMVQQLSSEVEGMKENLEKEKSQRKKLYEELQQSNIEKEELKESVERERREKEVQLVKLQDLSKENEKLQATLCAAESERGQLRDTLGKTNGELNNAQKELDLSRSSVKKLREEKMKITSELQDERAEKEETQQTLQKTVKQKDKYAEQVQQLEAQKATLQTSLDDASLTLEKNQENLQLKENRVAELITKTKNLEDERSDLQQTLQKRISDLNQAQLQVTEQSKDMENKNTQLQRLKNELLDNHKTLEEMTRKKDKQVEENVKIRTQVQEALEKEDERTAKADETLTDVNLTTLKCIKLANKGIDSSKERKAILTDIKKILEPCAAKINATTAGDKRRNWATLRALMESWKGKLSTDRQLKELYLENIRRHYLRLVDGLGYHLDTASGQDLLDKLYQESVIEESELEALRNTAQKPERSRKFLEILKSKNVKVFQRLIKILRHDPHREHLACAVEGTTHPGERARAKMAAEIVQFNDDPEDSDAVMKFLNKKDGVSRFLDAMKRHSQRQDEKIESLERLSRSNEEYLAKNDSEINALKQEIEQETDQKENYMQQVQEEKSKSEDLREKLMDAESDKSTLEATTESQRKTIENYKTELTDCKRQINEKETELQQLNNSHQITIKKKEEENASMLQALESSRRDVQTTTDELEKEKNENAELRSGLRQRDSDFSALKQNWERAVREKEELTASLKDVQRTLKDLKMKNEDDMQRNGYEMTALNEKLERTTNERDESLDRQKELKETMKNMDETLTKTSTEKVGLENALKTEKEDKARLRRCLEEERKDFEIKIQRSRNEEKILLQKCEKQKNDISALQKNLDDTKAEKEKLSKELCLTKESHSIAMKEERDATASKLQELQKKSEEEKRDAEARMQCKIVDLEYRNAELDDSLSREQARVKKRDETLSTAEKAVGECIQLSEQGIKERKERKEVLIKIKDKMELYTKRAYADQAGSSSKRFSLLEQPIRKVKTQREIYCDNLRAGWTAMIRDLDLLLDTESNELLDSLFQNRVIESAEYNKIRSLPKRTGERSREFLQLLMGKKPDSITKFIELLKEDEHARHLADIVEGPSAFSSGPPSSEDLASSGSDSDVSTERQAVQVSEPMS
ncbi:myosin-11 [Lingula anatina]|uniref:Myosin-11 n=1 Tax=Lingula anatina TaxID=7574 RepID=A0A1S3HLH1_LINAN|nr:myosin-11 [Lingula anatina]|eukprot:XP_013386311.1 myosin-11 [Lingula anatina]